MSDDCGGMPCTKSPDPFADSLGYFTCTHRDFLDVLARSAPHDNPVAAVADRAFDLFERGVAGHGDDLGEVACHGGCASCCTIRVVATAPEILAVARYLRVLPREIEVEMRRRIAAADDSTRHCDETQRWKQGIACPFVDNGFCVVYAVRPLACRGHASFDAQACIDALTGRNCEVPVSSLHAIVRSLVQNAMQSALRDNGYAWGVYELNHALRIAETNDAYEAALLGGEDIFLPALVADVSAGEMATTFDAIKARATCHPSVVET